MHLIQLLSLISFVICISVAESVITQTPSGTILGFSVDDVDIYLGIRYGEFQERWTSAKLPSPWMGLQNATKLGPICHQFGPYNIPSQYEENEQCLFLNVWVPTSQNKSLLPVRLWLHGGGYTAGSSNDYDAQNLTRLSQSIIVTINYRLGVFGFFPLPGVTTRNIGWLDQQLALRWVQENIASFGGDQNNVMLFGQSAGGSSTLAHLLIESSWSLYSSIIIQSSGPFLYDTCQEKAEMNIKLLETSFPECKSDIQCFRQLNASLFYEKPTINWITLWPCIGEYSQLQEQPLPLIRKGHFNKKASIMGGINSNEGQTSVLTFNQFSMNINSSQYHPWATQYRIPDNLTELYDPTTTDKDYFTALTWLFGDYYIHCPTLFLFDYLASWSSSSYAYFFVHSTENWAFTPFHFNASHLTEIPYVFNNDFAATRFTSAEANLSLQVINYFTAFHLKEQPWLSYKINKTVFIFDISNNGSTQQTQSGFGERLTERCPIMLRYVDENNCHAYQTQKECSNLILCYWTGDHCEFSSPSSSSLFLRHNSLLLSILIFVLCFRNKN